jgi:hypothetical protein
MSAFKIAIGCRSPNSKGIGHWDGAFVFCKSDNIQILALFQNNMDYINTKTSFSDFVKEYNTYISKGWTPMSTDDLTKTAGCRIDKNTQLNIPIENPLNASCVIN